MTAPARKSAVRVSPVVDLSENDTLHLKLYVANVGHSQEGLRAIPEREKRSFVTPLPPNGRKVLENAAMVGFTRIWPQLVNLNFRFFEIFRENWQNGGLIVTMVFCKPEVSDDKVYTMPEAALVPANDLLGRVYDYVHVIVNPDRSTSILAINARKVGTKPESILMAKKKRLSLLELPIGKGE